MKTKPDNRVHVSAPGAKFNTIGFWYKTQGGFFRAYSLISHIGIGPFFTKHDAIQFLIEEAFNV